MIKVQIKIPSSESYLESNLSLISAVSPYPEGREAILEYLLNIITSTRKKNTIVKTQ